MNYELDRFARLEPPGNFPFLIDHVVDLQPRIDGSVRPQALPLASLLFCDGCTRILSRDDVYESIDSYFCPQCLENMPSSEANLCGMRCPKCWQCPVCDSILTTQMYGVVHQLHYFVCGYCDWTSKGMLEESKPERLVEQGLANERRGPGRQRMLQLLDVFKGRAQEQQRERELAKGRAQPTAVQAPPAVSANMLMARRYGVPGVLMRPAQAATLFGKPQPGAGGRGSPRRPASISKIERPGPWRVDDLEASLQQTAVRMLDVRAALSRKAGSAAAAPGEAATAEADAVDAPPQLKAGLGASPDGVDPSLEVPASAALAGLGVDELLSLHVQPGEPLIKRWSESLNGGGKGSAARASNMHRLQQSAYGHQVLPRSSIAAPRGDDLVIGRLQLESPAWHAHLKELMPVRKPLLTRRSCRCRLPAKTKEPIEKSPAHERPSARSEKPCGRILIKPQMNPCANPPFQKNHIAAAFVPHCRPWLVKQQGGKALVAGDIRAPKVELQRLSPGARGELVFSMTNPLMTETSLRFDPTVFNPSRAQVAQPAQSSSADALPREFTSRQNVEVLTGPFETKIGAFIDPVELSEAGEEGLDDSKGRPQDDPDVIVRRKANRLLVRLRFQAAPDADAVVPPIAWVFFAKMVVYFTDHASVEHELPLFLRFALEGEEVTR